MPNQMTHKLNEVKYTSYGEIKVKRVPFPILIFAPCLALAMTFRVFTLSSILLRGEEVWNSLTKGSLSKGVFERRTSTGSGAFFPCNLS